MDTTVFPEVKKVGLVFKTHLDIGFTDFAANVVRRYMTDFIPASLNLAEQTRYSSNRFVWTTGSWLAYHYLEHSSRAGRQKMEEAIEAGDFYWHALPFTAHNEFMDESLFRLGLKYSSILDKRFGRKTRAAKATDVPGHSIGMVPLLAEAGVRFLHIGVNPASALPLVPSRFVWEKDGSEIVVMYDQDYGGVTLLPGGNALSVNLTGDNLGPQNPGEIDKVYERLATLFPQAEVVAGGMDVMEPVIWQHRNEYPVITAEIGDTWIHGVGTDPLKAARFHALSRLRTQWLQDRRMEEAGTVDLPFGEQLLLTAEHTWGMDLKTHLKDWENYAPNSFAAVRKNANFQKVEQSWAEQREYLDNALSKLPAELRKEAEAEWAELVPAIARSAGWRSLSDLSFRLGSFELEIDKNTGAIIGLKHQGEPLSWVDAEHPLALFTHQTYSQADYDRYYAQYIRGPAEWNLQDFTKPGLDEASESAVYYGVLKSLDLNEDGDRARWCLSLPVASRECGGPAHVWVEVRAGSNGLSFRVEWEGKPACRMPEAYWLAFAPKLEGGTSWQYRKLGTWINPQDVVERGNRCLHCTDGVIKAGGMTLEAKDAHLVAPGRGSLLDFSQEVPAQDVGVSFNLFNNKWGTNFPMWTEDDAVFRFDLRWGQG